MITCPQCGTSNQAGDAFCGSCGAFLDWAAEGGAAGAAPATPVADAAAETPVISTPAAPVAAAPATPPPPPVAAVPAAPPTSAPAPFAATGPTCRVCGRVNPAGRTFCISCGEKLPAAASAATPSATRPTVAPSAAAPLAWPSAAPVAPPTPAPAPQAAPSQATAPTPSVPAPAAATPAGPPQRTWDFPVAPTPVQPVAATSRAGADAGQSRGGRRPIALFAGLLLVAAILGAGAFVVLGGSGSTATPAPGATASAAGAASAVPSAPGASTVPSASSAPASPGQSSPASPGASAAPSASAGPSFPVGNPVGITISSASASTSLTNRPASNLVDGDITTTWKTDGSAPAGQWILLKFPATAVTRIQIWNGWQLSPDLYKGNPRLRDVTISFDGGPQIPLALKDVEGSQRVDIPPELGIVSATSLRIAIVDVYAAVKTAAGGSPTTQASVSEIRVYGIPAAP